MRLPDGSVLPAVEFDRHVASLFGRLGCNAGSCHGSFQGRGGLNLSLFGHDPARDFQALTRGAQGRRVNVLDPDRSLVLLKATGQVPHEGGQRFAPGSWEYRVIRAWIADGARRDPARPAAVERSRSGLRNRGLERPGATGRLAVVARFADGSEADVTAVLRPPRPGRRRRRRRRPRAAGPGPPARRHRGRRRLQRPARGGPRLRPDRAGRRRSPTSPPPTSIDREVYAKLRALGIDALGPGVGRRVPPPGHARRDRHPADARRGPRLPRRRLIATSGRRRSTALLAHPMHAALWATRYLDITGCDVAAMEGPDDLRPRRARLWHDWFRAAVRREHALRPRSPAASSARPAATATTPRPGPVARPSAHARSQDGRRRPTTPTSRGSTCSGVGSSTAITSPVEPLAERVATAFLGVRIECAQCHKHPFDRWTQADYRAFANIFADVQFGLSPHGLAATAAPARRAAQGRPGRRRCRRSPASARSIVSTGPRRRLADPDTGRPLAPRALGGPELPDGGDPRERLFDWLVDARQPVLRPQLRQPRLGRLLRRRPRRPGRRLLGHQPALEPRLLDALAADFVAHGYDIRRLERIDLELAGLPAVLGAGRGEPRRPGELRPVDAEAPDGRGPRRRAQRRARASPATSAPTRPKGARAIEIATNRVRVARPRPGLPGLRPSRSGPRSATASGRRQPALPQTLFLMTDAALLAKLKSGRVQDAGRFGPLRRGGGRGTVPRHPLAPSRPATRPGRPSTTSGPSPDRAVGPGRRALGADQHARIRAEPLNLTDDLGGPPRCLDHGPTARGSTAATSCGPAWPGCSGWACPTCSGRRPLVRAGRAGEGRRPA